MAKDLDEEFNLKIESAKKFKEYHDDLAKRHRESFKVCRFA